MKKLVFIIGIMLYSSLSYCQEDTIEYNKREYGDQYLLPGTFFDYDSCASLDIYPTKQTGFWNKFSEGKKIFQGTAMSDFTIMDVAQPYRTDTTLNIIGVSVLAKMIGYGEQMNGYLCIADSNLNILRRAKLSTVADSTGEVAKELFYYTELLFDTSINVNGLFYAVIDNPKPAPYEKDSADYNWGTREDFAGSEFYLLRTIVGFIYGGPYSSCGSAASEEDVLYRYFSIPNSDTPMSELTVTPSSWKTTFPGFPSYGILFWYIFPIVGELDTIQNDSSSVESIAVDNYTFVFPNPASDNVTVQCSFRINAIEIFNEQGQKNEELKPNGYNAKIDVSKYIKGNYILKIKTQSGSCSKKIVVQ